ncbi:hypothetical protein [Streptomyces sp. SID8111]|nr:hypothetical protein [Streptomyces sp. SID8111]
MMLRRHHKPPAPEPEPEQDDGTDNAPQQPAAGRSRSRGKTPKG